MLNDLNFGGYKSHIIPNIFGQNPHFHNNYSFSEVNNPFFKTLFNLRIESRWCSLNTLVGPFTEVYPFRITMFLFVVEPPPHINVLKFTMFEGISNQTKTFVNVFGDQETLVVVKHMNNLLWILVPRYFCWVIILWLVYIFTKIRVCYKVYYFIHLCILSHWLFFLVFPDNLLVVSNITLIDYSVQIFWYLT